MFTLSIAMMLAAGADLPSYTLPPAKPARCADACADRYRLPSSSEDGAAVKARALSQDGTTCNVTRSRICRKPPRTWLRTNY